MAFEPEKLLGSILGRLLASPSCVDLVTSEGDFVAANHEENPDLFWALRGGGGQFGIVTNFQYQLHLLGDFLGGMLVHPITNARDVMRHYRDFMRSA